MSDTPRNTETRAEQALQRASNLLACINELTLDSALGDGGPHSVWAAHHLGDMTKGVIDEALADIAGTRHVES
jgi:hypothetical protein